MFNAIKNLFKPVVSTPVNGATYNPMLDGNRLESQLERVIAAVSDGEWHDLGSLVNQCGGTHASISARLRDLRKVKFGGHTVESKRFGDPKSGLWKYRVTFKDGV